MARMQSDIADISTWLKRLNVLETGRKKSFHLETSNGVTKLYLFFRTSQPTANGSLQHMSYLLFEAVTHMRCLFLILLFYFWREKHIFLLKTQLK